MIHFTYVNYCSSAHPVRSFSVICDLLKLQPSQFTCFCYWISIRKAWGSWDFAIQGKVNNRLYVSKTEITLPGHTMADVCYETLQKKDSKHCIFTVYRGSPHFVISQFVIPAISWFCFRPNFMILKKKIQKQIFFFRNFFFSEFFFGFFFVFNFYL